MAPPTPVSISSKMSVGAEPRSASTTLSASRNRASSPPEATFISGPGRVPGLVRTQNSTRSRPSGPSPSPLDLGGELRPFELERLQFGIDRLVERRRRAAARGGERLRGLPVARRNLARLLLQLREPLGAGVDQSEIGLVAAGERAELVDRNVVLAPCGAQREQALLHALELARIVIGGAQRLLEMARAPHRAR